MIVSSLGSGKIGKGIEGLQALDLGKFAFNKSATKKNMTTVGPMETSEQSSNITFPSVMLESSEAATGGTVASSQETALKPTARWSRDPKRDSGFKPIVIPVDPSSSKPLPADEVKPAEQPVKPRATKFSAPPKQVGNLNVSSVKHFDVNTAGFFFSLFYSILFLLASEFKHLRGFISNLKFIFHQILCL